MDEVIQRFDALAEGFGQWKLRARASHGGSIYSKKPRRSYLIGEEDCLLVKRTLLQYPNQRDGHSDPSPPYV